MMLVTPRNDGPAQLGGGAPAVTPADTFENEKCLVELSSREVALLADGADDCALQDGLRQDDSVTV